MEIDECLYYIDCIEYWLTRKVITFLPFDSDKTTVRLKYGNENDELTNTNLPVYEYYDISTKAFDYNRLFKNKTLKDIDEYEFIINNAKLHEYGYTPQLRSRKNDHEYIFISSDQPLWYPQSEDGDVLYTPVTGSKFSVNTADHLIIPLKLLVEIYTGSITLKTGSNKITSAVNKRKRETINFNYKSRNSLASYRTKKL